MQKIHIDLQDGQKIWFTSDLHFGHRNILRFCNRPWDDEKAMGLGLIENWNSVVGDNDIVFVLGDTFWFNESRSIKKILARLKGKDIYILPGNHDDFDSYHRVDDPRIHLCEDVVVCWVTQENKPKREIWMSHYPMMTWPHRENGALQFFGHIHSNPDKKGCFQVVHLLAFFLRYWHNKLIFVNRFVCIYKLVILQKRRFLNLERLQNR